MINKIAIALDLSTKEEIEILINQLNPQPQIFKIGFQAIYSLGLFECLRLVNNLAPHSDIFLDLKLHDIPNTVSQAVQSLSKVSELYKIKYLTIHALGGSKMLSESSKVSEGKINLIAVTVLTSHSEEDIQHDLGLPLDKLSMKLAENAHQAGIEWLVSSAHECKNLKNKFPDMKIITPGIRPEVNSGNNGDQSRVMTPKQAIEAGADIMVIGRPIYKSDNPQKVWSQVLENH